MFLTIFLTEPVGSMETWRFEKHQRDWRRGLNPQPQTNRALQMRSSVLLFLCSPGVFQELIKVSALIKVLALIEVLAYLFTLYYNNNKNNVICLALMMFK